MRKTLVALSAVSLLSLAGCEGGYGGGVYAAGGYPVGPYGYDGFYDDYYGPFFDGYWGDDGFFYYRRGEHDHFRRGDAHHFRRTPGDGEHFHPMQGSMTPRQGMRMPHFNPGNAPAGHHRRGD